MFDFEDILKRLVISVFFALGVSTCVDTVFAQPLPEQKEVVPLVVNGIAVYDPALNVLMAMQTAGCAKLDITPINYTWTKINKEGCK